VFPGHVRYGHLVGLAENLDHLVFGESGLAHRLHASLGAILSSFDWSEKYPAGQGGWRNRGQSTVSPELLQELTRASPFGSEKLYSDPCFRCLFPDCGSSATDTPGTAVCGRHDLMPASPFAPPVLNSSPNPIRS